VHEYNVVKVENGGVIHESQVSWLRKVALGKEMQQKKKSPEDG
jgi:hypothetical protein